MLMNRLLKTIRESTPLLVKDVCALLGMKHWGSLSRIEAGKQAPSLEVVLSYHVLFGTSLEQLFEYELARIREQLRKGIGRHTKDLVASVRNIDVHERMNYLTRIYERISYEKTAD